MIPSKVSKVLGIVSPLVLLGALVGTMLAVNLPSPSSKSESTPTIDKENRMEGKAKDFSYVSFSFHEEEKVSFEGKEGATLVFFDDKIEDEKIKKTEELLNENSSLTAYFLYPFSSMVGDISQTVLTTYQNSPIHFGHDDESSSLLTSFHKDATYPYAVTMDKEGTIVSSSSSFDTAFSLFGAGEATLGIEVGNIIPELKVHSYSTDSTFSLREATSGRTTLINFWGTWCGPCVKELPYFGKLKREYPEIEIVAVHSSDPTDDVKAFIDDMEDGDDYSWKDYGIDFVQDEKLSSGKTYYETLLGNKNVYPYTFVLDSHQVIHTIHPSSITYEELVSAISNL
jgi:thiol-disulfide isomerase/thioredoxin